MAWIVRSPTNSRSAGWTACLPRAALAATTRRRQRLAAAPRPADRGRRRLSHARLRTDARLDADPRLHDVGRGFRVAHRAPGGRPDTVAIALPRVGLAALGRQIQLRDVRDPLPAGPIRVS